MQKKKYQFLNVSLDRQWAMCATVIYVVTSAGTGFLMDMALLAKMGLILWKKCFVVENLLCQSMLLSLLYLLQFPWK